MRREKGKSVLKLFFIIIFVCYCISANFFTHTHVIDKITIVHSHLHKTDRSDQSTHDHTENQIHLIHVLSAFCSFNLFFAFLIFCAYIFGTTIYKAKAYIPDLESHSEGIFRLRPPPTLIVDLLRH